MGWLGMKGKNSCLTLPSMIFNQAGDLSDFHRLLPKVFWKQCFAFISLIVQGN